MTAGQAGKAFVFEKQPNVTVIARLDRAIQ
jgi:hypothetical protein